jgi:hypothetical protein
MLMKGRLNWSYGRRLKFGKGPAADQGSETDQWRSGTYENSY